mgnify:CR=1 FL=1
MSEQPAVHPRDRFITLYGRKPVLEALRDESLVFGRLLIAANCHGNAIKAIIKEADSRQVVIERCSTKYVNRISRNSKQDQGVALDVVAKGMQALGAWIQKRERNRPLHLVLLDGVDTPANVGLLIRSARAFGIDGLILPRKGCPQISPLIVKASAGTALSAPILKSETAAEAVLQLKLDGFQIIGVDMHGVPADKVLMETDCVWVLGNETDGLSKQVRKTLDSLVCIPMTGGAESLNVACAGSIMMSDIHRRRPSEC